MLTIVALPSATSTIAQIGAVSNPWFTEFLSWIWPVVGVSIVIYLFLALPRLGNWLMRKLSKNYRFYDAWDDAKARIKMNKEIDRAWHDWKKSQ